MQHMAKNVVKVNKGLTKQMVSLLNAGQEGGGDVAIGVNWIVHHVYISAL